MSDNARTLEQARSRHGKPFLTQTRIARVTPPSPLLRRLNKLSAQAAAPASAPRLHQVVEIRSARPARRRKA